MADILVTKYKDHPVVAAYEDNNLEYLSVVHKSDLDSIYLCRVENVIKNLDSAFVKFADSETGYVPMKHILPSTVVNRTFTSSDRIRQGDEVILQVETEALKSKKAKLTSCISISGRYSVVTLGRKGVGASLKLDADKRALLIDTIKKEYPDLCSTASDLIKADGFGIIIRTEAAGLPAKEAGEIILSDVRACLSKLYGILDEGRKRTVFSCLEKGSEEDIEAHKEKAAAFLKNRGTSDINYLESSVVYSINQDVEKLLKNRVWLKSGGFLIIEQLESFNAIDVNTGKAIDGKKDASSKVNFEAAREIFRQIRLRNLSGMILIDFINMKSKEDTDKLCETVRALCKKEPVHTEFIDITGLGIVELTRNKNDKSLKEILYTDKSVDNDNQL
jgi:ribonuclease G